MALLLICLVACNSTRTPAPTTPFTPAPPPPFTPAPAPTLSPAPQLPSASAIPQELTVCLLSEPQSLYLYARPEPGRDHILAALYDGPIDSHDYQYQPILLTKLPSVADGDAVVNTVTVGAGDMVMDSVGRVVTLAQGVSLAQPEGATTTYSGFGPVAVPQMTVTFHLRPGVLWSDGEPLTADDSVFSFEVSLSPDSYNPRRDLAERTASYRMLNETTVEWAGLPGYLDPLYFTNFWTPLPRHVFGSLTPTEIAGSPDANRNPLGWGPFVLTEWASGDHLTFERNPNYFRAAEGLPRLDRLIYRFLPDRDAFLAEVQSGACDVAPHDIPLNIAQAPAVSDSIVTDPILVHLDFGIASSQSYSRSVGNDFFQDVRARQVFAHCLDRRAMTMMSSPMILNPFTYLPGTHPFWAADTTSYRYDPDEGRALLAQLGWADTDGDGILDKDGSALRLSLVYGPEYELTASNIRAQLRDACSIEIELRPITRGELEGDWPDGVIFGRRFDLAVFGWRVGAVPPCELFTTGQIPDDANPGGANDTGYSNAQFDAVCRRALTTFDPELSAQYHAEAQRIFARELPMLPLFFRPRIAAARAQVSGFTLDPTSPSELWNIEELAVAP